MRYIYRTYYTCDDRLLSGFFFRPEFLLNVNSFTFNGTLNNDGTYSAAPAWFNYVNGYPATDLYWYVNSGENVADGTYRVSFTATNKDASTDEYVIEFVYGECSQDITTVCGREETRHVVWLNREGGWSHFYFTGKIEFQTKIQDGKTYIKDGVIRYFDRDRVYSGEVVTTGSIPEWALALMDSLKYSIQVYLVDESNPIDVRYVPILLQDGDYTKRKTGDKIFDVSCKFIYADEIKIQTA